jgi:hypothetical protein
MAMADSTVLSLEFIEEAQLVVHKGGDARHIRCRRDLEKECKRHGSPV